MSFRGGLIALALLAGGVPGTAVAQRWARPIRRIVDRYFGVEVGLVGGVNRNTLTGAGPIDPRYRASGGVYASFPVADPFRFRAEVLVTGKQFGITQTFFPPCAVNVLCDPIVEQTIHSLTWLELPLLLEARFRHAFGSVTPRVFGGPFVAVRIACSVITAAPLPVGQVGSANAKVVTPCTEVQPTVSYNNGDAGFVAGGGLALGGAGLSLRWTRSLVPVAPSGSQSGALAGAKQSTLALLVEIGTRLRR
jgi:outer membrane protein with beta-barrel domain